MLNFRKLLNIEIIRPIHVQFGNILCSNDPGISRRKKMIKVDSKDYESVDFDEFESDFMNVHKSHKEVQDEEFQHKQKIKSYIIKQKYFKSAKQPNFLTWHDKQQMQYLFNSNSEEWTIERLAEGFPALPATIHKIVNSQWSQTKPHKIENHDKAVQSNWELFQKGEIKDLPEELKEHLKKFTNRSLNQIKNTSKNTVKDLAPTIVDAKLVQGEFAKIISSYESLKKKKPVIPPTTKKEAKVKQYQANDESNTFYNPSKNKSNKLTTLTELQSSIEQKAKAGAKVTDDDKLLLLQQKETVNVVDGLAIDELTKSESEGTNEIVDLSSCKYKTNSISISTKTTTDLSHLNYPEKITIPKQLFKKNKTYKLNDCYYDAYGDFLYRVPGMY